MSEATATILMAGIVQVAGMVIGFLTLWLKLRDTNDRARETAIRASVVESKLDDNTRTTNALDGKADVLVKQTNGVTETLQQSVNQLLSRVGKLEDYNREASHRVIDAVHAGNLKIAELVARTPNPVLAHPEKPVAETHPENGSGDV